MFNDIRVRTIKTSKRPVKLSDSGGLYLLIAPHGSKLWRLAYRFGGKQKTLAMGAYPTITLKAARDNCEEANGCSPTASILRRNAGWKADRIDRKYI